MSYFSNKAYKRKLEHYCAYQERSHFQVEKKMQELGIVPELAEEIILHLIKENYLNEERFAKSYVYGKFYHKKWGKQKIIQGLKQHRIHPNLISDALKEIKETDYQKTIKELILKKLKVENSSDKFALQQKIGRYLRRKGYSYDNFGEFLQDMI